jgi:hypothetical protein
VFFTNALQSFPSCWHIIKEIFHSYLRALVAGARLWRCLQLAVFIWCSVTQNTYCFKRSIEFKVTSFHTLKTESYIHMQQSRNVYYCITENCLY